MPIDVNLQLLEDDTTLVEVSGSEFADDLQVELEVILNRGGSEKEIILGVADHLWEMTGIGSWAIHIRWRDGFRSVLFHIDDAIVRAIMKDTLPEPINRVSRYNRKPVI